MTTTHTGVDTDGSLSRDEAAEALLSRWTDADPAIQDHDEGAKPIRRSETERTPDTDENQSEHDDDDLILEDEDEDQQDEQKADALEASPDAIVKLTVDGEEIKIPVKDLTRLYGQEASLTRKSQEIAAQRKAAEDQGARYVVATERLLNKAKERFQPYAQVDWAIAAKTLENDEYVALRQEAQAAHQDMAFLTQELDTVFAETKATREAQIAEEAKLALEVLQDPEKGIPGFNAQVYQDMTAYAVTQGLPEEAVHQLTDPTALKLIHKAMAYDRAKERAATKRKAAPTSKRTMQTTRRSDTRAGNREGDAMKRLKQTGSRDAAVAALMERWSDDGDQ